MENRLQEAIEQMRRKEEEGLRVIYSQTYNFVYLRAKSILKREEEIQKLVKEVYVQAVQQAKRIKADSLYEWLGKWTYILGCGKYRRKKVREVAYVEWEDNHYGELKIIGQDATREIICNTLSELPDMYQATLYAFYYDQMALKDISKAMDYSEEAIINRLNYTHKYLEKALENYKEETKINVQLSPEAIYRAFKDWSSDNCLSIHSVQSIYMGICRELGYIINAIEVETEGKAGAEKTIANYEEDDLTLVYEELAAYSVKPGINKQHLAMAGVVAAGLLLVVLIVAPVFGNKGQKEEHSPDVPEQEQEVIREDTEPEDSTDEENIDINTEEEIDGSEYILPQSNVQRLTRADLEGLSKEQLRLARNEIYARHGMIFGAQDLATYFASQSWYTPTIAYADFYEQVTISEIEAANVALIVEVEEEKE